MIDNKDEIERLKKEVWYLKNITLPDILTQISTISEDSAHGTVTDSERALWNNKLSVNGYSVYTNVGSDFGQGYIDYKYGSTTLRHAFGLSNANSSVSFSTPFSTIIWANSSDASQSDAQSQRTTISSISTTGLSFKGGVTVPVRWEAWGIL